MDDKLLHITKVKEMLDVDLHTLQRWERQGLLHPVRIGGGKAQRRYKISEINALIEKYTQDYKEKKNGELD